MSAFKVMPDEEEDDETTSLSFYFYLRGVIIART
jgi:hypothetical protein